GKELLFEMISGLDVPANPLNHYALVIQCGGCMITHRQVLARIREALKAGVPVSNYGMAIAYTRGIFDRATRPLLF
ncbi:MAG TPA: [FeFe] hydrogenase H-cluster maturation GTPase HydF, partial [Rikenellaceae bacterium]|nr:[FeFe] hydrogenase H-cluster maturation GTPase HydF [Rikenellaceae bacterium]